MKGQSLVEVLIGVALGALLLAAGAAIIAPSLRINSQTAQVQTDVALAKELSDNVKTWAAADWHNVANLATTSANQYYLNTSASPFKALSGSETVLIGGTGYQRYFYVDDVQRDSGGNIATSSGSLDPSTKKVTVCVCSANSSSSPGIWVATTPLPSPLVNHSAVAYNGYVYTTGGSDTSSTVTSTVYYAQINSSTGALGAWATTNPLPSALYFHSAVAYNGYVYTTGGDHVIGANATTTVFYTPINADGTLGPWATTTKLPGSFLFYGHSAVAYNGYIYVTGGGSGGATVSTVYYAPINADGTLGAWATTVSLPSALANHSAVVNNGYIYTTGGSSDGGTSGVTSSVFYAPVNATGSLGAWTTTISLPSPLLEHSAVLYNGYIYTTGGDYGPAVTSSVFYAPVNATGSLGAWARAATTPLPSVTYQHSAVVNGGYIYVTGGNAAGGATSSVLYALLPPTTYAAVSSTYVFYLTRHGNNIIDQTDWSGGPGQSGAITIVNSSFSTSSQYLNYASTTGSLSMNLVRPSNGSLGVWATTTPLPTVLTQHSAVAYNGYIYTISGSFGGAATSSVFYAPITASGTLGSWSATTPLPSALSGHSAVVNNGYIYVTGGTTGGSSGITSTVFYAQINSSTAAVGSWSTTTPLPTVLRSHSAVVNNGYIYTTGGNITSSVTSTVFYAQINSSTGAVGSWSTTTKLPSILTQHSAVVNNGYIYTTGGTQGSTSNMTSTVFYSQINSSTAALGAWSTATSTPLPSILYGQSAIVSGGYLYTTGGSDTATTVTSTVFYSQISSSTGAPGSWITASSTPLPSSLYSHSAVVSNGYIYTTGGSHAVGASNTSTVFYAPLSPTSVAATATLDSSVFDTGVTSGAQLNSVLWQGSQPAGTSVGFQFATSNSSGGPWTFVGSDGTGGTFYTTGPGTPLKLDYAFHNNFRYFRYRVQLTSDLTQTFTPRVDDIIINWSP